MSRHPEEKNFVVASSISLVADRPVHAMVYCKAAELVAPEEIADATNKDADLVMVKNAVASGK